MQLERGMIDMKIFNIRYGTLLLTYYGKTSYGSLSAKLWAKTGYGLKVVMVFYKSNAYNILSTDFNIDDFEKILSVVKTITEKTAKKCICGSHKMPLIQAPIKGYKCQECGNYK